VASPLARQADAAKVLLREIALATSASEAALVASNLEPPRDPEAGKNTSPGLDGAAI
jgi:hypothetical protein